MKMVTIYVDEDEWKDVTEKVLQLSAEGGVRISNGEYLMRLHRANISDKGTLGGGRTMPMCTHTTGSPPGASSDKPDPIQKHNPSRPGGLSAEEIVFIEKATPDAVRLISKEVGKKPKKNSKQASACPECRAPAGHRAGCKLGKMGGA